MSLYLANGKTTGGVRDLLICPASNMQFPLSVIMHHPTRTIDQDALNQNDWMHQSIHLENIPNGWAVIKNTSAPKVGNEIECTLTIQGFDEAIETELLTRIPVNPILLVGLYALPKGNYLLIGDKYAPAKIISIKSNYGDQNNQAPTITIQLTCALLDHPPIIKLSL